MTTAPPTAAARALESLDGLSIGDAFGERFFGRVEAVLPRIARREVPQTEWPYTDDTEMALSIVRVLLDHQCIEQDTLARLFAERMDSSRGYGPGAFGILSAIARGGDWRMLSHSCFGGNGSFGNGAAMRVAPLGAYFADRPLEDIVRQARQSAEITHAHPEGIAGAVAVAVAAALASQARGSSAPLGRAFVEAVRDATPPGDTRDGISECLALGPDATPVQAARILGNGAGVTAPDTVPFCLWVCSRFSHDFVESMWNTVTALGDRDTTCAIVGGIVACQTGRAAIPEEWFELREAVDP
ncbi:MAG TPA: ADP-ribosylglycohydrolase family protein [Polyangiaceae bacterium]